MSDNHEEEFDNLLEDYNYSIMMPLEAWSTGDLVKLANLIDIELQQRAHEAGAHLTGTSNPIDFPDEGFCSRDMR
jgi:hypothetical protein